MEVAGYVAVRVEADLSALGPGFAKAKQASEAFDRTASKSFRAADQAVKQLGASSKQAEAAIAGMMAQAARYGAVASTNATQTANLAAVNPVSLATLAIVGGGAAAFQYFTEIEEATVDAEKELKRQADLIRRVADEWGEALPALKAYADELDRQQSIVDRQEAVQAAINKRFGDAEDAMEALRQKVAAYATASRCRAPQALNSAWHRTRRATWPQRSAVSTQPLATCRTQ